MRALGVREYRRGQLYHGRNFQRPFFATNLGERRKIANNSLKVTSRMLIDSLSIFSQKKKRLRVLAQNQVEIGWIEACLGPVKPARIYVGAGRMCRK